MNKKVLIIDDDMENCRKVKYALQDETTDVYYPISIRDALDNFTKQRYCLVIMDLQLRETDGLALIGTLRSIKTVPILVLSSRTDPEAKAEAYQMGANHYLQKPYDLEECLTRARSLMAYYLELGGVDQPCYTLVFGTELLINPLRRQVLLEGKVVPLTRKEFDLLYYMASHPRQVFTRRQLYQQVWDSDYPVSYDHTVRAHINTLRKKLSPKGHCYIKNCWGVGFCFDPDGKPDSKT